MAKLPVGRLSSSEAPISDPGESRVEVAMPVVSAGATMAEAVKLRGQFQIRAPAAA
jgi:hypothetical protein